MARDDFPVPVKRTLAARAAHFCSNPRCLRLTTGPNSKIDKLLPTGHAAHIHAASKGGARYLATQTEAERTGIDNGIWLCRECGPLVDGDADGYPAHSLRAWRADHEAMIAEVRQKGYSESLALIQAGQRDPQAVAQTMAIFEDHRALWTAFDAEFPDRVRQSLDRLRGHLTQQRMSLHKGSALDRPLQALGNTILAFFVQVGMIDLTTLRCNSNDPEWRRFSDALATLRKSIGFQLAGLSKAYSAPLSPELRQIAPIPLAV